MAKRAQTVVRGDLGLPDAAPPVDLFGAQVELVEASAPIGRPAGSINRNSAEMRRVREALGYRRGIIALAELGSGGSIEQLAARVNRIVELTKCKPDKAWDVVLKGIVEYSGYDDAKIQPDAPAKGDAAGVVILVASSEQIRAIEQDQGITIDGAFARVENQGLTSRSARSSDTDASDTEA